MACEDQSLRLRRPLRESGPLGKLLLLRAGNTMDRFCRAFVGTRSYPGPDFKWPTFRPLGQSDETFRYPAGTTLVDTSDGHFSDIDNDGKLDRLVTYEISTGGLEEIVHGVLPQDASDDEARTLLEKMAFANDDVIRALRGDGYKIFAGDQTAFHSVNYVFLEAFRYEDTSWFHATLPVPVTAADIAKDPKTADTSTDVILKPAPEGGLQEICAFRQTPRL
jgi:hypothetical protein